VAGAYGGVWRSLRLAGVWSLQSCGRFCVGASGFSRREDVFTFHLLYKFCTFNVICKDSAAINCITFQNKFHSLNSDGSCATLVLIKTDKVHNELNELQIFDHSLRMSQLHLPHILNELPS
jgi:hypothetical protein